MLDFRQSLINSTLRKVLKRLHYPLEVMLTCVRWYVAYPLSLLHVEEMMQERGFFVDHVTVHRWAMKMLLVLADVFRRRKRQVGRRWRVDETYIKVAGQWRYLYRAVNREGETVDFLLTAERDLAPARRLLERAIKRITRPMPGFKSFWSARIIIAGIETMHIVKKGQMDCPAGSTTSAAKQFYRLAA